MRASVKLRSLDARFSVTTSKQFSLISQPFLCSLPVGTLIYLHIFMTIMVLETFYTAEFRHRHPKLRLLATSLQPFSSTLQCPISCNKSPAMCPIIIIPSYAKVESTYSPENSSFWNLKMQGFDKSQRKTHSSLIDCSKLVPHVHLFHFEDNK